MTTKLPPLPEPYEVLELYGQNVNVYSTAQVEQIRRETVQACAAVARKCLSGFGADAAILALLDPLQRLTDASEQAGLEP